MSEDPKFQLQLLGGFSLRQVAPADHAIVVLSKKARTLLAYVAMQEPMRASRERLAGLLWPDRIDRQARQNLRQCVAALRHDLAGLADDLLVIDREAIGLGDVLVDARQLGKLAGAEHKIDLEAAAVLYKGQFLADLALEGEELRDWALAERARLDSAAGTILSRLARDADAAGDPRKALRAAAQLTSIDPLREDWARLSLRLTARYDGRDRALLHARDFIALLRSELDVDPEPETVELIEQIKSGRIAPIRLRDAPLGDASIAGPADRSLQPDFSQDQAAGQPKAPVTGAAAHSAPASATVAAGTAAAAVIALLAAYLAIVYGPGVQTSSRKFGPVAAVDQSAVPLLVLPFQSDSADADFARALTDEVLTSVSRFSGLTIFDGRTVPQSRGRWGDDAGALGVRFAAWGSVRRQGSLARVNIGLGDAANNALVWADDIAESDGRNGDLQTAMARRIARELQVQTIYAQARDVNDAELSGATPNGLIAKALSIQYRGSTADGGASAMSLYQEALRRDHDSALALVGLAAELATSSSNFLQERKATLADAEKLIKQALQINPRIERAHYWLGVIDLGRGQREAALQAFDRALALNPSFVAAEAHAGYALVLLGRTDEGLTRIENALAASSNDPNERVWLRFAGIAQLERGNDRQAIEALAEAASLAPPAPPLHAAFAAAYALMGESAESREHFRLMRAMADPTALQELLEIASRNDGQHSSRYWQGLRLAAAAS